ncbi:MAG: hypothetical protein AAGC81_01795 [Pseudomonadota bacterium]
MRYPTLAMLIVTPLIAACESLQATEEVQTTAICAETRGARQVHADSLLGLGSSQQEQKAKRTGVRALSAVAGGCGELEGGM